jgi:hypothetical protein
MPATPEDFERAVELLLRLIEQDVCHVIVLVPVGRQYIQFTYSPSDETVRAELENASMSRRELSEIGHDISEALTAAVEEVDEAVFAGARANPDRVRRPRAEPETEQAAKRKLAVVKDRFDVVDLRRRAWMKQTSKSRLPLGIDWEINLKIADDDAAPPTGGAIPYATVLLSTASRRSPYYSENDEPLDLDRQDVDVLIASLQRLRRALVEAERNGASA